MINVDLRVLRSNLSDMFPIEPLHDDVRVKRSDSCSGLL